MPVVYKDVEVEVEIDMEDFTDENLLDEFKRRELNNFESTEIVRSIYEKRRLGQDYQRELDELIYDEIGRIA